MERQPEPDVHEGSIQATGSGFEQIAITAGPVRHKKE